MKMGEAAIPKKFEHLTKGLRGGLDSLSVRDALGGAGRLQRGNVARYTQEPIAIASYSPPNYPSNVLATPCPKCGATKTESAHHGVLYRVARLFGYRLRVCSRCRRKRFLRRDSFRAGESPEGRTQPAVAGSPAGDVSAGQPPGDGESGPGSADRRGACPRCGKYDFRRSHRRFWERLIGRGRMVRCRNCRYRFPKPDANPYEPAKS